MQLSKKLILFFIVAFIVSLRLNAQCESSVVDSTISIQDIPIEINGSTSDSGDDFIVIYESEDGSIDTVAGYASNDKIYQFTLGFTDDDLDFVNDQAINLFVDMCRNGVSFDASIAIVKADGIDCSNVTEDELIITHYETVDAGALCPEADYSNPAFLPIARDIYLDQPGIYYIVVDGYYAEDNGDFSMVIGEMSYFEDYPLQDPHQPQNLWVDIEFSTEIYGVNDDQIWSIGSPLNAPDYFRAFDENGNAVGIGNLLDLNNEPLQSNTGYSALRFPLIDQPDHGASIFITTVNHDFISGSDTTNAPHPVNGNGIPFTIDDMIEIELHDIIPPTIDIIGVSDNGDPAIVDPDTGFIIISSESLLRGNTEITLESIEEYITVTYVSTGMPIDFTVVVNDDQTEITIDPSDPTELSDHQWEDISITLVNEINGITITDDPDILHEDESCPPPNTINEKTSIIRVNDITPPEFDEEQVDDPLGRGNDYITIIISEPIYTDSSATGAVNVDDFNLDVDYGDEDIRTVESISIESISDESGGILVGGETILRLKLSTIGPPNGTENVSVQAAPNQIYDLGGNAMSAYEASGPFDLSPAPLFSQNSELSPEDNSYIRLVFENGPVFHNENNSLSILPQDFMVQLTNSDGDISEIVPTYIYIVDENDNVSLATGAHFVKVRIELDFEPEGDETIMVFPQSSNSIFNQEGVSMDESESAGHFELHDQLKPFYNINIAEGDTISWNETILLTFNEPISLLSGDPLTDDSAINIFEIWDVSRTDDIIELDAVGNTTIIPADQSIPFTDFNTTVMPDPGPVNISVTMIHPFRSESNMSITIKNNIQDMAEFPNQLEEESTITFKSSDNIPPDFISGSAIIDSEEYLSAQTSSSPLKKKICYVDLTIDDNVFTDASLTDPVQAGDFIVGIIQHSGSVSSGDIEYVELVDNGAPEVDRIRFKIRFDEIPSGGDSLFISPAGDNSICDAGPNFMNADSKSDTLAIGDLRFPTISSTSIEHEGHIDLMSDSEIMVYFSEPINTNTFDHDFISTSDGSGFTHSFILEEEFLQIVLDDTLISYDILDLTINHLEDISGNIMQGLIKRRFFTKAAGDFSIPPDDRVNVDDLNIFKSAWNSGDYSKNLGPYEGTPPNIKITQDNLFGIDDGMAFTQMWLWSLQTFGPSLVVQEQLVNLPSSILYSDNTISIMPPDNALSGQVMINYDVTDYRIHPGDNNELKNNGILLGNNNDQMGISLIEYALHKNKRNAVSFNVNKKHEVSSKINLKYSFFDENFRLISKGDSILHSIALPTEFTLMQNYPNPFNPSTTIRFTIPSNSFVRLIVYDITGKVVNEIVNGFLEPGVHNVEWSGTDTGGIDVSSGLYFYKIEASNYSKTYKMVFVK